MIITCEECSTRFVLDDSLIKPNGSKVRCSKCRHVFTAILPEPQDESLSPASAIPLPEEPRPSDQPVPEAEEDLALSFDAQEAEEDDSDSDFSEEDDFSLDSDAGDPDLGDDELDFSGIETEEPEPALSSFKDLPDIEDESPADPVTIDAPAQESIPQDPAPLSTGGAGGADIVPEQAEIPEFTDKEPEQALGEPTFPEPETEPEISFDSQDAENDLGMDDFSLESDSGDLDQDDEGIDFGDIDADIDMNDADLDKDEAESDDSESSPPADSDTQDDFRLDVPDQDSADVDSELDVADFDMDEPELDFQEDTLELEAQDFEFEEIQEDDDLSASLAPAGQDDSMADIEISFDQDDDTGLELEELPLEMDETTIDDAPIDDLEFDIEEDDEKDSDIELKDDPDADLVIEDDGQDLALELDGASEDAFGSGMQTADPEKPDDQDGGDDLKLVLDEDDDTDAQGPDTDGKIQASVSEQEKFAEYDKVLEQETEPDEAGLTIPDPEVEEDNYMPADQTEESGVPIAAASIAEERKPLIPPPTAQSVRQKRRARKKGLSLPVKILLVLLVLIMAAYVAIIRLGLNIPVVSDIQIPFITEAIQPKKVSQAPLKPVPNETSINGRFISNKSAGELFIVTGRIENPSNKAVSYIQVKGTLLTKGNKPAGTQAAYCGNIISEDALKTMNISDITKQMGVREGTQNTNVNIKPGGSVMFMLVFSNLPENLTNFTVSVQGFEPAKK